MAEQPLEDVYAKAKETWIETYTGTRFNLLEPEFHIQDIAHALSQTIRFGGHGKVFTSVAEHAVLVSQLMERYRLGDPFEGLHHDDTEAYLSDVPSPIKQLLPDWKAMDRSLEIKSREFWGIPEDKSPGCTEADSIALFMEADEVMPGSGREYLDPNNNRIKARHIRYRVRHPSLQIFGWSPAEAKKRYFNRHRELLRRRSEWEELQLAAQAE